MQMAEHKKLVDQRKKGVPGSKEAEVFHLQEAMEERNEKNVRPNNTEKARCSMFEYPVAPHRDLLETD